MTFARIIYCCAIFVSSALLFLVQPMAAKMLLPNFGGSPGVWTAAMLFFQFALLGGYAYAHFSTKKLGVTRQRIIHLVLMGLVTISLPFNTSPAGSTEGYPPAKVFLMLLSTVGLGYFVVSSGSPTLQRWFASTEDPAAKDPYFLYAISNIGSMVGLFAYPFYVERHFRLAQQAAIWHGGFLLMVGLFGLSALFVRSEAAVESQPVEDIPLSRKLRWLFTAALPSSLLLGVTNNVSGNIAPIPLIWVLPLAAYLLSFTVAFAARQVLDSTKLARLLPLLVTPLAFTICIEATEPSFRWRHFISSRSSWPRGFVMHCWPRIDRTAGISLTFISGSLWEGR